MDLRGSPLAQHRLYNADSLTGQVSHGCCTHNLSRVSSKTPHPPLRRSGRGTGHLQGRGSLARNSDCALVETGASGATLALPSAVACWSTCLIVPIAGTRFFAQQAAGAADLQTALPFPAERRMAGALRWRWAIGSSAGLLSAVLIVALVLLHRDAGSPAKLSPTQMAASGQSTSQTQNGISPSTPSVQIPTESNATAVLSSRAETAPKSTLPPRSSRIAGSAQAGPRNTLEGASASKALTSQATPPNNVALTMNTEVAGSVIDPSGAAIPGAKVSLRLPGATTRQATTDPSGHFAIPSVPLGNYTVEFNAAGFQTAA